MQSRFQNWSIITFNNCVDIKGGREQRYRPAPECDPKDPGGKSTGFAGILSERANVRNHINISVLGLPGHRKSALASFFGFNKFLLQFIQPSLIFGTVCPCGGFDLLLGLFHRLSQYFLFLGGIFLGAFVFPAGSLLFPDLFPKTRCYDADFRFLYRLVAVGETSKTDAESCCSLHAPSTDSKS